MTLKFWIILYKEYSIWPFYSIDNGLKILNYVINEIFKYLSHMCTIPTLGFIVHPDGWVPNGAWPSAGTVLIIHI